MSDSMAEYLAQAWSLQGQLPLLIIIAALLGLGKGGVPGFATVATAATAATSPNIPGGLGLAVALQVPILTMIDISAAWLHAKDLDFDTIKLLLPLSFVGMFLGQWLDKHLSDAKARMLVGIFLLIILTVQVGKDTMMRYLTNDNTTARIQPSSSKDNNDHDKEIQQLIQAENGVVSSQKDGNILRRRSHSDENDESLVTTYSIQNHVHAASKASSATKIPTLSRNTKLLWACIVGIVGGAATMLTNAMGPILNVYLLSVVQLSPTAYIGTRAMFFCFLNIGKIPMRFAAGTLGWSMLPLAGFLGIFSVIGVFGAKPIMLSMKEENFVKLELAVVLFSGLRLVFMGLFP